MPARDIPFLAIRCADFERLAWREGVEAARAAERRCVAAFVRTAGRALREADVVAHEPGTDLFVAVLRSEVRNERRPASPGDCRAALARLAHSLTEAGGTSLESGWVIADGKTLIRDWRSLVDGALARGAVERERLGFLSTIGHELRTPLAAVRGYLETVLDETGADEPASRRFLEIARAETLRMTRLIDGLLDISLFDPSDFPQPGGTARVATAVDEAHQAVLGGALRRDIRIERTEDAHLAAAIDKDRLVQVLIILLDNAIKHGRENGLITIAARRADGFVELVVDDDGPGIEAADRERIFSLAWRGASSGASGWGIGLAVARRMLERAGGRIEAGDSPLGGARFLVRLSVSAETGSTKEPLPPGRR